MEDITEASQLILQLLCKNSPELGARLKQRLNSLLINKGRNPFDERNCGYKRFSDFLQDVLGNKVSIERPDGAGDILVSLRHPVPTQSLLGICSPDGVSPKEEKRTPVIRSDMWEAFTNPDPKRKRFFQKETRAIRHFLQEGSSPSKEEIERDPSQFIEITPISGQTQVEWMRVFLDLLRLPPSQRQPFDALISQPYTSGVNAAFTRALGENGYSWRQYRTNNILEIVKTWTKQHQISFDTICAPISSKNSHPTQNQSTQDQLTPSQQAIKLLELLTEEDIARLVIPTLLSTILVKSRL